MLLDFRLADSFPTKVLALTKGQMPSFVEKAQVFTLVKSPIASSKAQAQPTEERGESRSSAKRSLFEVRMRTPAGSVKSQAIDKMSLTSGFVSYHSISFS